MTVNFITQTSDINEDMKELFCEIDNKIQSLSKNRLDAIRFEIKIKECKTGYLLIRYREILIKKLTCSSCLTYYDVDEIISNIKQLLSSGKIKKVCKKNKKIDFYITDTFGQQNEKTVINNNLIINTVNNNNTTITEVDNWDAMAW